MLTWISDVRRGTNITSERFPCKLPHVASIETLSTPPNIIHSPTSRTSSCAKRTSTNVHQAIKPSSWGTSTPAGWSLTKVARTPLYIARPIRWDVATPAEKSPTTYNQPKYALSGPPSHQSPGLITSSPSRALLCLNFLVCI